MKTSADWNCMVSVDVKHHVYLLTHWNCGKSRRGMHRQCPPDTDHMIKTYTPHWVHSPPPPDPTHHPDPLSPNEKAAAWNSAHIAGICRGFSLRHWLPGQKYASIPEHWPLGVSKCDQSLWCGDLPGIFSCSFLLIAHGASRAAAHFVNLSPPPPPRPAPLHPPTPTPTPPSTCRKVALLN